MKKIMQSQKGITGIEITVAVVILTVFVSLISTVFINIYLNFSDSQRNTVATGYATQLAELIDKMYYADVSEESLNKAIQNMSIPSGYVANVEINDFVPEGGIQGLVKTVLITVNYKVGNNTKTVEIEKIKAKEILITPNKPKLSNGMVPVKYQNNNWVITTEDDTTWYNYDNKRWANIMLQDGLTVEGDIKVTDENRQSLAGKRVKTLGSMFVWIPRYAYKIPEENFHTSNAGEIDIIFLYSTSDNYVDENGNMQPITNMEGYKIHPSFQNGEENNYANGGWDTELTGYWVAKFEASSTDTTAEYGGGDTTELDIKVLPSVPSWRNITANNMFTVCKNMANNGNIYNLSNNAEPHMMKNTEWGAVAYLSHSKYGMNGQVWNNPYYDSSTYTILTGKVAEVAGPDAGNTTICDDYNEGNGPNGSTTGNVYGVYDMAGGSWEYAAAYVNNGNAQSSSYITKLREADAKYKDVYDASTEDTAQKNYEANTDVYGDAVYETSYQGTSTTAWQNDCSDFPYSSYPVFVRSSNFSSCEAAGVFFFGYNSGGGGSISFRPVITIP